MQAAQIITASGQKFRQGSEIMTGSVVVTGQQASGLVCLTADRHSYTRHREVRIYGLIRRPMPDWPVPAPKPDLP